MEKKGYQMPYSYNGTSTRPVDNPKEIRRLNRENKHLAQEVQWFLKRQEPLSEKLTELEDKLDKLKSDPNYKVNTTTIKKSLIVRKCRNASSEVKKVFSLLGVLNKISKGVPLCDEDNGSEAENMVEMECAEEDVDIKSECDDDNGELGLNNCDAGDVQVKTRKAVIMKDGLTMKKKKNNERKPRRNRAKSKSDSLLGTKTKVKLKRESSSAVPSTEPSSTQNGEPLEEQGDSLSDDDSSEDEKIHMKMRAKITGGKNRKATTSSSTTHQNEYICDQCGKVFTGHRARGKLTSHVRYHNTPRLMVECEICGKKVKGKYKLVQHIKDHSREKQFKCTICGKEFLYKYNLMRHMLLHSGEKPFSCHICHRTFRQKNQAEQHMDRIHVKKKTARMQDSRSKIFMCLDCNASFLYFNCLVYHFKVDHVTTDLEGGGGQGEGEVILFNSIAQRHMLYYMKELPLIKGFPNLPIDKQLAYFEHPNNTDECCAGSKKFQKHFGFKCRKNYLCTICGQVYAHQGALQVHMRIHSNERPFQCNICLKRFRQRPHLTTHMRHHMGIKRHKCVLCGKDYSQKPDLIKHLAKIHNKPISGAAGCGTATTLTTDCNGIAQTKALESHQEEEEEHIPQQVQHQQQVLPHQQQQHQPQNVQQQQVQQQQLPQQQQVPQQQQQIQVQQQHQVQHQQQQIQQVQQQQQQQIQVQQQHQVQQVQQVTQQQQQIQQVQQVPHQQQLHHHLLPLGQTISVPTTASSSSSSSSLLPPPSSSFSLSSSDSSSLSLSKLNSHVSSPPLLALQHQKPLVEQGDPLIGTQRVILTKQPPPPPPHEHSHSHSHCNLIPENSVNVVTVVNLQCANPATMVNTNSAAITATTALNAPIVLVQQQQQQQQLPQPQQQLPQLQPPQSQPQPTTTAVMGQLPNKSNEGFPPMSDFLSEEYNNSQRYHTVVVPSYNPDGDIHPV